MKGSFILFLIGFVYICAGQEYENCFETILGAESDVQSGDATTGVGYRFEWTLDEPNNSLSVRATANRAVYIGVGFRENNGISMENSDIIISYVDNNGQPCFRSWHVNSRGIGSIPLDSISTAESQTTLPLNQITNRVVFRDNIISVTQFTRPINSGSIDILSPFGLILSVRSVDESQPSCTETDYEQLTHILEVDGNFVGFTAEPFANFDLNTTSQCTGPSVIETSGASKAFFSFGLLLFLILLV